MGGQLGVLSPPLDLQSEAMSSLYSHACVRESIIVQESLVQVDYEMVDYCYCEDRLSLRAQPYFAVYLSPHQTTVGPNSAAIVDKGLNPTLEQ